jgi:hypothetical protein
MSNWFCWSNISIAVFNALPGLRWTAVASCAPS